MAKKEKKTYTPTVNGRASICTWNLQFMFRTREQCLKFINLYLNEFEYASNIEYKFISGDSVVNSQHWVLIEEMSWAKNLARVGELLVECDYTMGY